jgi:hypothetical protein
MQNKVALKQFRTYRTADNNARVRMAAAVRKDRRVAYIRITTWVRGSGIVNDQYKTFDSRDAANAFWLEADEQLAQHFICE